MAKLYKIVDKLTNDSTLHTSVSGVADFTGLTYSRLVNVFSVNKRKIYQNSRFIVTIENEGQYIKHKLDAING